MLRIPKRTLSLMLWLFITTALCHVMSYPHVWAETRQTGSKSSLSCPWYPSITKYAIALYGINATERDGDITILAAQLVIKGKAVLTWQTDLSTGGDYEVVLAYSAHQPGAQVEVVSGKSKITDTLHKTEGVYSETGQWYLNNFERKLLKGTLCLSQGFNTVSFYLTVPSSDSKMVFYALELNPLREKDKIIAEIRKARQMRPNMDWFAQAGYGVMFHWTSQCVPRRGKPKSYQDAVASFDVDSFVEMVKETGAAYVIFTANHADPHFPAPLQSWEKIHPGWTTPRDLVAELADKLNAQDIKLILYFATHVYGKFEQVDSAEFVEINHKLISEVGARYGEKVAGYWFDGWYQCYERHPHFPFESFYQACKVGYPERLIALNSWLYPIVSEWQDYWAGEIYSLGVPPLQRIIRTGPAKGLQYHALLAMNGSWVHTQRDQEIAPPVLNEELLIKFIKACKDKGPVTINLCIYQDGTIGEKALSLMRQVKRRVRLNHGD